jgi:hypothetical protein
MYHFLGASAVTLTARHESGLPVFPQRNVARQTYSISKAPRIVTRLRPREY